MDEHEVLVEWCWQEKTEVRGQILPQWKFDHNKSHMDWPQNESSPEQWEAID